MSYIRRTDNGRTDNERSNNFGEALIDIGVDIVSDTVQKILFIFRNILLSIPLFCGSVSFGYIFITDRSLCAKIGMFGLLFAFIPLLTLMIAKNNRYSRIKFNIFSFILPVSLGLLAAPSIKILLE